MSRNPKVQLEERLRKFNEESEGFKAYKELLSEAIPGLQQALATRITSEIAQADHNYALGMLHGITKAINNVDAILKQLAFELEQEKAKNG